MSKTELLFSLIFVAGVFISSISQVLLKKSAVKEHTSVVKEYMNPYVIFAYAMFFAATLFSIIAYRVIPLSLGTMLDSLGYIFVSVFGVVIFKEKMGTKKIISLVLIITGIVIYTI